VVGSFCAQAIVLQRTLAEVLPDARLTVLCLSPREGRILRELGLEVMDAVELEGRDPALAAVRETRSEHDYCWTLKAPLMVDLLQREAAGTLLTYVDADIAFHSDPTPALDELRDASIGLSDHRYAPAFRSRERWAGRFNTGWISFRHDPDGLAGARWWRERVIEWCRSRVEDGRYGDQRYVEEMPARFGRVAVHEHPGVNVAPWRDTGDLEAHDGRATIEGRPVLFFHAQSVRLRRPGRGVEPLPGVVGTGYVIDRGYRPTPLERDLLWDPYMRRLGEAVREMVAVDPTALDRVPAHGVRERATGLARRAWMRSRELQRG
jgi:hypothetical protein